MGKQYRLSNKVSEAGAISYTIFIETTLQTTANSAGSTKKFNIDMLLAELTRCNHFQLIAFHRFIQLKGDPFNGAFCLF